MRSDRQLTLWEVFSCSVERFGAREALRLEEASCTYEELAAGAEIWAHRLIGSGVRPGERVGILLPNSIAYLELVIGAAMVGIVTVPMNIRFKSREILHLVTDSAMVTLVTVHGVEQVVDFDALLLQALPDLESSPNWLDLDLISAPALRRIVRLDDAELDVFASKAGTLPAPPTPRDWLFILYTSGTTANPKGCIIPHRALISNCWGIVDRFGLAEQDVWWCPLPMFHIGGLLFPTMMFAAGGTYAGMTHFDPDAAIGMMKSHPPTIFYPLFPTITLALTEHPNFDEIEFNRLRYLFNVAPEDVQRKIQAAVPEAPLFGAFGMTEASGTVCYGDPGDETSARFTSCGKPLPGWEVKIVAPETRVPLPTGQRGEIAIRGDGLFAGYFGDAELTQRQLTSDGFFLTGDVGSLDEEGRLSFHGRFKDQLKVGGENVSALEVESFLASHPLVHLAQVVGIADEKYGEVPAAFVELKPGHSLTEAELIAFCRDRIARFKVPRHVRFVTEWPMSATKIVKYRLREQLERELAQTPGR